MRTASFSDDTLKKEKQAAYTTDTCLVSEANGERRPEAVPLTWVCVPLIYLPRPRYSERSLWPCGTGATQEPVRNAESQALAPQWSRGCVCVGDCLQQTLSRGVSDVSGGIVSLCLLPSFSELLLNALQSSCYVYFFPSQIFGFSPINCVSPHALGCVDSPQITDFRAVSKGREKLGPRTSFQNANAIHYRLQQA